MSVNAYEQYMLELINRARLDPEGEAALLGLDANALGLPSGSLDVLAFDNTLAAAATEHSDWMLATDTFSHTGDGGTSAGERIEEAGYIFATGDTWAENIALWGTSGTLDREQATSTMHANLFESDGHRANLLSDAVTQVGVAIERGDYYGYDTGMTTQNFASAGGTHFLTGVVYVDKDNDAFYSIGEGKGGTGVKITGNSTETSSAGGYSVALGGGGDRMVVLTTAAKTIKATVSLDGGNVKLDLVNGNTLLTTADLDLGTGARHATALGTGAVELKGNIKANTLTGNDAANILNGAQGDDRLDGAGGNDQLYAGWGDDIVWGGAGRDMLRGQRGSDSLYGGHGADLLWGASNGDLLRGNDGQDRLYGGAGNDTLGGGRQDDVLTGGQGKDVLTGGAGADLFVFRGNAGRDKITDFEHGVDHLRFTEAAHYGQINFTEVEAGLRVEHDTVSVLLAGLTGADIDKGDFLFG